MAAAVTTNGHATPKIKLYTNHGCPYAHCAHIALQELDLPYEESIIDLNTPRPQWYLDINPRGLVPTIKVSLPDKPEDEIIYESAVVARFLADAFPGHLLPQDALGRARINFFIDTWETSVRTAMIAIMMAQSEADKEAKSDACVAVITKEIEPLLANATPFFGGSEDLTLVEVMAAPMLVRTYTLSKDGELTPHSWAEKLDRLPSFAPWAKAIRENESVNSIYQPNEFVAGFKEHVKKMKAKSG